MTYRIRYRDGSASREDEIQVQANSPTEAMIKFQHGHNHCRMSSVAAPKVTSVQEEPELADCKA